MKKYCKDCFKCKILDLLIFVAGFPYWKPGNKSELFRYLDDILVFRER